MKYTIIAILSMFFVITACNTNSPTKIEQIVDPDTIPVLLQDTVGESKLTNEYILSALEQIGLDIKDCQQEYISEGILPYDDSKSVIIIPEISKNSDENNLSLDAHILIMDRTTKKIENAYSEKEAWESNAMVLISIELDSLSYKVNSSAFAFGVLTTYSGSSRVYPYSVSEMSWFIPDGTGLRKILKDYPAFVYRGEYTMETSNAASVFAEMMMLKTQTNNYFDILVKARIEGESTSSQDESDVPVTEESVSYDTDTIRFVGNEYFFRRKWNY